VTKIFLDTNILVYAVDRRDTAKHARALQLVGDCMRDGTGVVSTQVLQEFASVALGKLRLGIDVVLAELTLLETLEIVQITPALIRRAVELHARAGMHYWDASILAAAESARCTQLWSEDFGGEKISGILRVENPLPPQGR
jgi:predicted nucleic acid-binding protein